MQSWPLHLVVDPTFDQCRITQILTPTKSRLLPLEAQPAICDMSSRGSSSGKYKSTLSGRVKLEKSSCQYHKVPVPRADTIMCSWAQESYERIIWKKPVSSSSHISVKRCTFQSLPFNPSVLHFYLYESPLWPTPNHIWCKGYKPCHHPAGDTGHCSGSKWLRMSAWRLTAHLRCTSQVSRDSKATHCCLLLGILGLCFRHLLNVLAVFT